uniref:Uncharacterized protein n=1 Tax=Branchiostoma floridae TaxID=7739 RepID=C3Y9A5_BRAFL|eukprot:XP_002607151.1 hypothetical protein BRAFLDRAFT_68055 [Branchiostoma floridae]
MFGRGLNYDFHDDCDYDYDESDGDRNYESDDSYTSSLLLGKSIEEASFHIEEGPFRIKNHVQGPKLVAELASQHGGRLLGYSFPLLCEFDRVSGYKRPTIC